MSDAGPSVQDREEPVAPRPPSPPRKPGMLADPVVLWMTFAAFGIVVLALLVGLGVMVSGVASSTGPRTLDEKELVVTGQAVRSGKADSATWGAYIAALIANERYTQAQTVIDGFKKSNDSSATAEMEVAQARLDLARKDYQKVVSIGDAAQKSMKVIHQARLDGGGQDALTAKLDGLPDNWFALALIKAEAYKGLQDWKSVVKELDSYIAENPEAADILVDRGRAKVELGDKAGAKADFKKALRFIPDDKEALQGLNEIGATAK